MAYNRFLEDLLGVSNPDQNISPAQEAIFFSEELSPELSRYQSSL